MRSQTLHQSRLCAHPESPPRSSGLGLAAEFDEHVEQRLPGNDQAAVLLLAQQSFPRAVRVHLVRSRVRDSVEVNSALIAVTPPAFTKFVAVGQQLEQHNERDAVVERKAILVPRPTGAAPVPLDRARSFISLQRHHKRIVD